MENMVGKFRLGSRRRRSNTSSKNRNMLKATETVRCGFTEYKHQEIVETDEKDRAA